MFRSALRDFVQRAAGVLGYRIERIPSPEHSPVYDADGLKVFYKQVPFLGDPDFMAAYRRGANSGHYAGPELRIEWRVAVTCWAAQHGSKLDGDFVECGVNTGMHSLAICQYLDFNSMNKRFYLFDTYSGIPDDQMSDAERSKRDDHAGYYSDCYEQTRKNFSPFSRAILVRGKVPETLGTVDVERVAFLHIDMNIAYPERKAIEFFWPKLSSGAMVVLDDYGWRGYEEQFAAMNDFARQADIQILALPTGQGLMIKP